MRVAAGVVCLAIVLAVVLALASGPSHAVPSGAVAAKPQAVHNVKLPAGDFALLITFQHKQGATVQGTVTARDAEIVAVEPWRSSVGNVSGNRFEVTLQPMRIGARRRQIYVPNGVIVRVKGNPDQAVLKVETNWGSFEVPCAQVLAQGKLGRLNGRALVRSVAVTETIAATDIEEDFPSIAVGRGMAFVVYVAHSPVGPPHLSRLERWPEDFSKFRPKGGGDQLLLLANWRGWSAPFVLTDPGLDLWRPSVALAGDGTLYVCWSQNVDGNWDLFYRTVTLADGWKLGPIQRLTTDPGADINVKLVRVFDGSVWAVWQGWREGDFQIFAQELAAEANRLECGIRGANEWNPDVAADSRGHLYVAYDTYAKGNYDVRLWTVDVRKGSTVSVLPVADSPAFEANAAVAVDSEGRVWVAWERRGVNWGKDQTGGHGTARRAAYPGSTLYDMAEVHVAWLDGSRWQYPTEELQAAMERALAGGQAQRLSYPKLAADGEGRVWVTFRRRVGRLRTGTYWQTYVTSYDEGGWRPPVLLPGSDNLLDSRPAVVGWPHGGLLACTASDGRLRRARRPSEMGNDLYVSYVPSAGPPGRLATTHSYSPLEPGAPPPPVHLNEPEDVERMREFRLTLGGRTYRLMRGEFHRHTEISLDGGNDGALEDMWRYALDAAKLDWIGNGDHDNGAGREYTWWLTQKTTDIYHHPPTFVPVFSYERSVRYPDGHRNVMFAQRGIRPLPRLRRQRGEKDEGNGVSRRDTQMLYAYLRQFGGICAVHTSATDMGTDWRDHDPEVEPVVEIYQGARQSYEHRGAPRTATGPEDALGGWRPLGFVWRALMKGYRLGFQASSDHVSTHISYAMVFVTEATRDGIVDAFRQRHCYAATDNILLVVTCGEHLMGDRIQVEAPVTLDIHVEGTAPIEQIDIIRGTTYVYAVRPNVTKVTFQWRDSQVKPGEKTWYYVRVRQVDGQLAWSSPIWVQFSSPR